MMNGSTYYASVSASLITTYAGKYRLPIPVEFTFKYYCTSSLVMGNLQITTRWLYCVECPQYSTRRRSAYNIHRSGMLPKTGRYGKS